MNRTAFILVLMFVPACDCGSDAHDVPKRDAGPIITMPDDAGTEDAGDDAGSPAARELHELLQLRPARFPLPRGAQFERPRKVVGC